jgi:hypothetical protein
VIKWDRGAYRLESTAAREELVEEGSEDVGSAIAFVSGGGDRTYAGGGDALCQGSSAFSNSSTAQLARRFVGDVGKRYNAECIPAS